MHMEWRIQRRLCQLREDLHDFVKSELGKSYNDLFSETPFARSGGLKGTTARLTKWLEKLSFCINQLLVGPLLVAFVLSFFEAPAPEAEAWDELDPACQNFQLSASQSAFEIH